MRRLLTLVLITALVPAASAHAAQIVTITTTSQYVDPAKVDFNKPPCGAPARPNALRVDVSLPDGYDQGGRWPVLYLLHGHGDSFDAWPAPCDGDLEHTAAGFPGIVVMPEAAMGWYANWWDNGQRSGPAWENYHLDELIPYIEQHFRIRTGRQWHAIAGLSMGGEGAAYYAEQRPGYFGSIASFSGTLDIQRPEYANGGMDTQGQKFTDVFGPPDGFYATGHNPDANVVNLQHTRVYVTVGNGVGSPDEASNYFGSVAEADIHQQDSDFVSAAKAAGVDVTYVERQGIHAWNYWRQHLAAAIQWGFFKPVPDDPTSWTMQTVSTTGDAWGFEFAFAKPPTELITFARKDNMLSAKGSGTVTITTPQGARFTAGLPFERAIPAAPPRHRHKKHRHRHTHSH